MLGVQFHRHAHLAFRQGDGFDASNVHARHFDAVADLEFLRAFEISVDAQAAAEAVHTSGHFQNQHSGNQGESHKEAQTSFQ